jgi:hypothetical protein
VAVSMADVEDPARKAECASPAMPVSRRPAHAETAAIQSDGGGTHGVGYGRGGGVADETEGGGGAYGGAGTGTYAVDWTDAYGDINLENLYGGSGGGAGFATGGKYASGGGGGGALEFVARGALFIGGTLQAVGGAGGQNGGVGGGGSGGGILFAGQTVSVKSGASISVKGADREPGHGGAGGRMACYVGPVWGKTLAELEKQNGNADNDNFGGDSVSGVPGLSWQGGECVDLRPGLGNSSYSNLPSGKGTFRCVWAPPPAGAVLVFQ